MFLSKILWITYKNVYLNTIKINRANVHPGAKNKRIYYYTNIIFSFENRKSSNLEQFFMVQCIMWKLTTLILCRTELRFSCFLFTNVACLSTNIFIYFRLNVLTMKTHSYTWYHNYIWKKKRTVWKIIARKWFIRQQPAVTTRTRLINHDV